MSTPITLPLAADYGFQVQIDSTETPPTVDNSSFVYYATGNWEPGGVAVSVPAAAAGATFVVAITDTAVVKDRSTQLTVTSFNIAATDTQSLVVGSLQGTLPLVLSPNISSDGESIYYLVLQTQFVAATAWPGGESYTMSVGFSVLCADNSTKTYSADPEMICET